MCCPRTGTRSGVRTGGGKLFATYLKDVTNRAYVYSVDGKIEKTRYCRPALASPADSVATPTTGSSSIRSTH
jgi:hypothetical protein